MARMHRAKLYLFLVVDLALVVGANLAFAHGTFDALVGMTGGVISRTLAANLLSLGLLLATFRATGVTRADLGVRPGTLLPAMGATAAIWGAVQVFAVVGALAVGASVTSGEALAGGVGGFVGTLAGQLLGNALYEEVGYRGFVLGALLASTGGRRWRAVLLSSGLFALRHIPAGLLRHMPVGELVVWLCFLVLLGGAFAALYLRTGNLLLVVGVHALVNAPSPLVDGPVPPLLVVALGAVLLAFVGGWPRRRDHAARETLLDVAPQER